MGYKISGFSNGGVEVAFDDGKKQHLSGMPMDDADALDAALTNYEVAYLRGLALETPTVAVPSDAVKALIGKQRTTEAAAILAAEAATALAPEEPPLDA